MNIKLKNTLRVLYYGWKESKRISGKDNASRGRISIYLDIIRCFRKYQTLSPQYSEYEMYKLTEEEKDSIGNQLKEKNKERDHWEDVYNKNWRFLNK